MNLNGVEYYYIRNAQGDIIGLFDNSGTVVASYIYDSWGKLISINGTLKDSIGVKNPYRYRGYRYDSETGLYYLNSRYYNAEWGRFINADIITGSIGELLTANMFAYCRNNPVNHADPDGDWVLDALFLAADVGAFLSHPSFGSAGWILLDIASFADPTGIGSATVHAFKTAHAAEEAIHAVDVGKNLSKAHKFFNSEKAARRAAFRDAGIGKHGGYKYVPQEFNEGSRHAYKGTKQVRQRWKSVDTGKVVAHDRYGHKSNPFAGPHYNVYSKHGNTHYYYPSRHNPLTNR